MNGKRVLHNPRVHQPNFRAKIIGGILIIIGLAMLVNPTPFYIKLSFAAILIGVLMMLLITEQSVPRRISEAQNEGNLVFVQKMTKDLELEGNAVFLPKSRLLSEERVYISSEKTTSGILPYIDDNVVLSMSSDGEVRGISVPPSGLRLLKEIKANGSFYDSDMENIEERLQSFVGMDILKSVTLKKDTDGWKLELGHQKPCSRDQPTCNQYPCSACSAVLTAITQAAKEKIQVIDTTHDDKKTIFHLRLGEQE
jgi:hypothetical protein